MEHSRADERGVSMVVINLVDVIFLFIGLMMVLGAIILFALAKIIDVVDNKKKKKQEQMKGE